MFLQKLSMTHCGLTTHVTSSELAFPSVESLDLSHNHFYDIPSRVVKIVTIEHLNMSHNSIRYLDGQQLSALTNLRSLDLSYNDMEVLQDDPLESMAKLETVSILVKEDSSIKLSRNLNSFSRLLIVLKIPRPVLLSSLRGDIYCVLITTECFCFIL